jgi:hypothetical protein
VPSKSRRSPETGKKGANGIAQTLIKVCCRAAVAIMVRLPS